MRSVQPTKSGTGAAFSLMELMVAVAILSLMLVIVINTVSHTNKAWVYSSAKIEAFQDARLAFESITRAVSRATLNTYYDYYDASRNRRMPSNTATFLPDVYGRCSELEFVCGKNLVQTPIPQVTHSVFFQTPLDYTQTPGYAGLGGLLNLVGFYVEFDDSNKAAPSFAHAVQPRYRYRLMELLQPTEDLSVYSQLANGVTGSHAWFTDSIKAAQSPARLLAENIIACVVCPKLSTDPATPAFSSSLTTNYEYDSNVALATPPAAWTSGSQPQNMNQLPPVVRIVLVAVGENSMNRLQGSSSTPPDLGFNYSQVFQNSSQLDADIETVSKALASRNISFRIFQTDIAVRGAKWSP